MDPIDELVQIIQADNKLDKSQSTEGIEKMVQTFKQDGKDDKEIRLLAKVFHALYNDWLNKIPINMMIDDNKDFTETFIVEVGEITEGIYKSDSNEGEKEISIYSDNNDGEKDDSELQYQYSDPNDDLEEIEISFSPSLLSDL